MKTIVKLIVGLVITILFCANAEGQTKRKKLTVLRIDTQGLTYTPEQMGNLVRIAVEKLDTFEVMDKYDVSYLVDKHKLKIDNCYGKICLTEIGDIIATDKMLTGSVELIGETIILNFRLIDILTSTIEKAQIREFLNLPKEIQTMIQITLNDMFKRQNSSSAVELVTRKFNFENEVNNPDKTRLNLSGPRMGAAFFSGKTAKYLRESKDKGGFDAVPVMFQFGYQFEVQYLNQGNFQALFEFIPTITGLDQNLIMPSFTILNGLRNNKNGFEFALGPTFSMVQKADGYYDNENNWHLEKDMDPSNPYKLISRLDNRGEYALSTGFIFGIGKTFRSGRLNIPVNLYMVPSTEGFRCGLSFGYNVKKEKEEE